MNASRSSLLLKSALALAMATPLLASAESQRVSSGSASARLDFEVKIPRVLFLGVGTGATGLTADSNIDTLTFDYSGTPADVGSGTDSAKKGVDVRVMGNDGQITLAARGSDSGLVNGAEVIPWSEILATSSDATNLDVPAVGGTASPMLNSTKVTTRNTTWNYAYSNTNVVAPGTYTGQITYTASMP